MKALAIIILGPAALPMARRLQAAATGSQLYMPRRRLEAGPAQGDTVYDDFGSTLRQLHQGEVPVVALCSAGIVIRALAPSLVDDDKQAGTAVVAMAPDGSSIVPLLGGLRGVNDLARDIARLVNGHAAITTSGELRFGTCLLQPPAGYVLADIEQGKTLVSNLLAGDTVSIQGHAPWLDAVDLPRSESARQRIRVSPWCDAEAGEPLRIYPRCVALACSSGLAGAQALQQLLRSTLEQAGLASAALAVLLVPRGARGQQAAAAAATALGVELRLLAAGEGTLAAALAAALPANTQIHDLGPDLALAVADQPLLPEMPGEPRGRLSVIGLGPGDARWMVPAAREALERATDVLGYATYVEMAGPLRADQQRHPTDNRQELQRAAHAFELAAQGRRVALVSSGDPGVFAMAAATLEALETSTEAAWHEVELEIIPGVSAAMATAAVAGAPLGHDFCMLSLSDNLKPWSLIERRLQLVAEADLAMAWYNPISRHRPWQLGRALEIVRQYRAPTTPVLLGRDIARPGARLRSLTLGELRPELVDMRTLVIVGASTTRRLPCADGRDWVYTPRSHPGDSVR